MARVGNLSSISEIQGRIWVEDPGGSRSRIYSVKPIHGQDEDLVRAIPYDLLASEEYSINEVLEDIPERVITISHAQNNPEMDARQATAGKKENQKDELSFEAFLSRYGRSRILGRG